MWPQEQLEKAKPEATLAQWRSTRGPRPGSAAPWVSSEPDSRVHPGPPSLCSLAGLGSS